MEIERWRLRDGGLRDGERLRGPWLISAEEWRIPLAQKKVYKKLEKQMWNFVPLPVGAWKSAARMMTVLQRKTSGEMAVLWDFSHEIILVKTPLGNKMGIIFSLPM